MKVTLLVTNEKAKSRRVRLGPTTVIGRSPECNLKIASAQVSRKHCVITVSGNRVSIRDLGSANGTEVDGQPIPPEVDVEVAPGSKLVVGPLKFVVQFEPASVRAEKKPATTHDLGPFLTLLSAEEDTKDYIPIMTRPQLAPDTSSDEWDLFDDDPATPEEMAGDNLRTGPPAAGDRPAAKKADPHPADPVREATQEGQPSADQSESATDLMFDSSALDPPPNRSDSPPTELLDLEPIELQAVESNEPTPESPEADDAALDDFLKSLEP